MKIFSKRMALMLLFVCFLSGMMTGCGKKSEEKAAVQTETEERETAQSEMKQEETAQPEETTDFPGSYTVPDGWVKAEQYSTADKIFYVEEGHENDEMPDNISIEVGKNRYSEEEHMEFRDAIVRQLTMQMQGLDAELTGDGTYTEQDYIVYIFTISEPDVTTRQYYIIGDQRYCLIHLTNFTGSESAEEAAQTMADSFVWN